jgi:GNAT superfamily N-acetyltransferase
MNIIPLSKEYLEETIRIVNEIFPYDINAEWNPARSFNSYIELKGNQKPLKEGWLRKLDYWIVLAPETNEVIGVTGLYHLEDDPDDLAWLGWYCVREDHRGKGLGRELLEWTIERAKAEGYKRFKLYTSNNPNEARAQALYEKFGFKIVGEEVNEAGYQTIYREKTLI